MESKKNGIDDLNCKTEIETQRKREQIQEHQAGRDGGVDWEID